MLVRLMRKLRTTPASQDNGSESTTGQRNWPPWMPSSEELRVGELLPVGWTRGLKRRGFRRPRVRKSHLAVTNPESHLDEGPRRARTSPLPC